MSYQFPPDISAMIQHQLSVGGFHTEDDVLRAALEQLTCDDDDVRAVQESLEMMDAGEEGQPLAEVVEELRKKYGIPADA